MKNLPSALNVVASVHSGDICMDIFHRCDTIQRVMNLSSPEISGYLRANPELLGRR